MLEKPDPPATPANAFFLLHENVLLSLQYGTIGHLKEMKDVPLLGMRFLICDSKREVVLGPFIVSREQYHSNQPIPFVRRIAGSKTEPKDCYWLFEFEKVNQIEESELGLPWTIASSFAGIPHDWWENIRRNRMDESQFEALCQALIETNQMDVPPKEAVPFSELQEREEDTGAEDLAYYYGEEVARYSEEGDPINRQAFIDMMFGGDPESYESNWPDS